ncbi:MAG TPA: hypothetical protein VF950_18340 [Planctomycetota bacterium]
MIALAVIAIAILGVMSLLIALQARNESFNTSRQAVRACQEVLEVAITESAVMPMDEWAGKWDGVPFEPRKVFVLEKGRRDGNDPVGDATKKFVGRVTVKDVSEPEFPPGSLYEIAVAVDTTGLTPSPIKTSLVTRRSRP